MFIVDRFLAASLGRPTAISEDDCSEEALRLPLAREAADSARDKCLGAAVRTCKLIGVILKKVYAQRTVKCNIALDIVEQCGPWPRDLDQTLHWRQLSGSITPDQGIAILHVNLLYCHSVILLTRPFFIILVQKHCSAPGHTGRNLSPAVHKLANVLSEVCIAASYHTISMVQTAYEKQYLPRRNPFVM